MHSETNILTNTKNLNYSTTMGSIDEALAALKGQEHPNYTTTAKKFKVDRSTLSRRHRGVTGSKQDGINSTALLTHQQERSLVQYINKLTERGFPPTNAMINVFAHDICGNWPGKN
jgi:hypothetical protein